MLTILHLISVENTVHCSLSPQLRAHSVHIPDHITGTASMQSPPAITGLVFPSFVTSLARSALILRQLLFHFIAKRLATVKHDIPTLIQMQRL